MRRGLGAAALALALCGASPRAPLHLGPASVSHPARVVTLAPSLTEAVLALGAGDRLVGVTRFDEAPEVKSVPRVGGYIDPSVEVVISLHPDLVIAEPSPGNRQAVEHIADLGTPVLAVPLGTEEEIFAALREVGRALGLAEQGAKLAEATRGRLRAVRERARPLPAVRVLIVNGWEPMVVAGPQSFGDMLLSYVGAVNAAAGAKSPYPVFTAELAMQSAPQVVVDASAVASSQRERILALPGIDQARVVVASPGLYHPGPRIAEAVEELFALLHPAPARRP